VNRSVAVLDGAVLVVDAVAGVQAQTETVWRAITMPSLSNNKIQDHSSPEGNLHQRNSDAGQLNHDALPCLALVNKMDKEGCHFGRAMQSLREKLPGANPIPTQIPLFSSGNASSSVDSFYSLGINDRLPSNVEAVSPNELSMTTATGNFIGIIDLIRMRAIIWQDGSAEGNGVDVDTCTPTVVHLMQDNVFEPIHEDCKVTKEAMDARFELVEALAEVDVTTEEQYLNDQEPSNFDLCAALRRATLAQKAVPVMAAAALKGKGLEPLLDSIADFLPSPLDRNPPALHRLNARGQTVDADKQSKTGDFTSEGKLTKITRGHPLHKSSLALAFKVVHMKGRGSGDGRVVFARIYSGKLRDRDQLTVSIVSLFMFDACTVFESTYLEVEEWFCRPIFFCTIRITPLFSA
jgi:elongation factor G